jgi:thiopurine S-methyltransferase
VFDRAAIIALPPEMRERYVREVYGKLPSGCRGLLITLEYPQQEKAGPPFSVAEGEVRALFEGEWRVTLLERRGILEQQPSFQAEGVTALATAVYRLERR